MKTDIKNLLVGPFVRVLLLAILTIGAPTLSSAAVFVSVNLAPPLLPVYTQPIAPGPGYMWTPGYWAYGPDGYYWVPGVWVLIPFVGALWTPGYWGWGDGSYVWHAGYWARHVGFYGGVNYGFGYSGEGYQGGRWNNGTFMYNTAVNNINRTNIHNTYDQAVTSNANASRVSYNGGTGGLSARPTAEERLAEHDQHRAAMPAQLQHEQAAKSSRGHLASVNHAAPAVTASAKQPAIENHHAVGTMGPAHANVANGPCTCQCCKPHPGCSRDGQIATRKRTRLSPRQGTDEQRYCRQSCHTRKRKPASGFVACQQRKYSSKRWRAACAERGARAGSLAGRSWRWRASRRRREG